MAKRLVEKRGFIEAAAGLEASRVALNGPAAGAVMLRGAKVIAERVRQVAPFGIYSKAPGTLKKAVMITSFPPQAGRPAGAVVFINYAPRRGVAAPHAHLANAGAQPHIIRAKDGKDLVLFGGQVIRKEVQHPGAVGRHFWQDAISDSRLAARKAIREGLAALVTVRT